MLNINNGQLPSNAYLHLKTKYKNYVFLYRSGSFYLTYGNDAIIVSKLLDVPLTNINGILNMAILPYCSFDECLDILVTHGHRVAMAEAIEQVEDVGANCAKQANLFDI